MLLNRLQTVHTTCILMLVLLETTAKILEVKVSIPIDLAHLAHRQLSCLVCASFCALVLLNLIICKLICLSPPALLAHLPAMLACHCASFVFFVS
jgi:hypothetical protein